MTRKIPEIASEMRHVIDCLYANDGKSRLCVKIQRPARTVPIRSQWGRISHPNDTVAPAAAVVVVVVVVVIVVAIAATALRPPVPPVPAALQLN